MRLKTRAITCIETHDFKELMEGLPRSQFQQLVDKHEADKYSKGFTRWNQLVSMIFAQVSGSKSLRTLESRLE